jgi:hypothetical protein
MASERLMEELLIGALDDWLHLADVAWAAREFGSTGDVISDGLRALGVLLKRGLIELGEVSDGGFFAWDLAPLAALEQLETEWRALGHEPQPGDVCWIANTPTGDIRARELLRERGEAR